MTYHNSTEIVYQHANFGILNKYGNDVIVRDGMIYLYFSAVSNKEEIMKRLVARYNEEYSFREDFYAGNARIEVYNRKEYYALRD